jgi:outer membrane protein assembly factor BamA
MLRILGTSTGILIGLVVVCVFSAREARAFQVFTDETEKEIEIYKGKWISEVVFEGNNNFQSQELLNLFNFEDDIAGTVNRLSVYPYNKSQAYYLDKKLRDFYRGKGYLDAVIGSPTIEVNGDTLKLVVPIKEGIRYRFGNVKISGAKLIPQKQIAEFLGIEKNQIVDLTNLHKRLFDALPKLYGDRGYAWASVEMDHLRLRANSKKNGEGSVDFDVVIDEGLLYRVKEIIFAGDADEALVRSYITFKQDEIFSRAKIEQSLKNLNDSNLFREVDFEGNVEIRDVVRESDTEDRVSNSVLAYKSRIPNGSGDDGLATRTGEVSVTLSVRPADFVANAMYYVASVEFKGNKTISDAELLDNLKLQKNARFDIPEFIENVRRFNSTGKWKPIIENDIDLKVGNPGHEDDATSDQLHIVITIRELNTKPSNPVKGGSH